MRQAVWEKNDCSRKKIAICGHENPGWPSLQRWIDRNLWDPLWKMRRAFFRKLRQAAKISKKLPFIHNFVSIWTDRRPDIPPAVLPKMTARV